MQAWYRVIRVFCEGCAQGKDTDCIDGHHESGILEGSSTDVGRPVFSGEAVTVAMGGTIHLDEW